MLASLIAVFAGLGGALVIRTDAEGLADSLTQDMATGFWEAIMLSTQSNLDHFVWHIGNSPINAFPDKESCRDFDRAPLLELFKKLEHKPWLIRQFLGSEGCAGVIAKRYRDLVDRFLQLGFSDKKLTPLIPAILQPDQKQNDRELYNARMAWLSWRAPMHPELSAWVKSAHSKVLKQSKTDLAAIVSKTMLGNRRFADKTKKPLRLSLSPDRATFVGVFHYLSVTLQSGDMALSDIRDSVLHSASAWQGHRGFSGLLQFVGHVTDEGSDPNLAIFVDALASVKRLPWSMSARICVDMIITWVQRYKVNPLKWLGMGTMPHLLDEHIGELLKGIQHSTIAKEVTAAVLAGYPWALCQKFPQGLPKAGLPARSPQQSVRCNARQAVAIDKKARRFGMGSSEARRSGSYEEFARHCLLEMWELRSFFAISSEAHFPGRRLDMATLLSIVEEYGDLTKKGRFSSAYGHLPTFKINVEALSYVPFAVLNYSMLRFGRPPFVLEQSFCRAIARGGNDLTSFLAQELADRSRDRSHLRRSERNFWDGGGQFSRYRKSVQEVLRGGAMKGIAEDKWCSLIGDGSANSESTASKKPVKQAAAGLLPKTISTSTKPVEQAMANLSLNTT